MLRHWFSSIWAKEEGKDTTRQKGSKQATEVDKRWSMWLLRKLGESPSHYSTCLCSSVPALGKNQVHERKLQDVKNEWKKVMEDSIG